MIHMKLAHFTLKGNPDLNHEQFKFQGRHEKEILVEPVTVHRPSDCKEIVDGVKRNETGFVLLKKKREIGNCRRGVGRRVPLQIDGQCSFYLQCCTLGPWGESFTGNTEKPRRFINFHAF